MGVAEVQFHSKGIGQKTEYSIILPEEGEGPFPVLLQLHGLSDNHRSWIERSNLVRHVERYPFIVVLPNGGTSGYVNWPSPERLGKQNYEDLLMEDIPAHVNRHFNARPGPWAIGGLSMGGYGSMRLALKYPERFASVWAHSSAFHIGNMMDDQFVLDRDDLDVFKLASKLAEAPGALEISFDCGVDDENLIDHNRELHAHMDRIGLKHHYAEHPGAHTWDYWDDHVREALVQHARVFGVEKAE
ncbi:MAG: alpha/beta hydrolase family protein [Thermomicrobiales bacterium]